MLVKLLKYELKSTSRIILYIYAGILAAALLLGIVTRFLSSSWTYTDEMQAVNVESGGILEMAFFALFMIYFFLVAALGILTLIMIIMRFYNNLLQGEGYLMHTLPVPTWMLVASKLIVAVIWNLVAGVVIVVSGLMIAGISGLMGYILQYVDIPEMIREILASVGTDGVIIVLLLIFGALAGILQFYFCMSVGNLSSQHKMLASVGAFVGIQVVISIISSVVGTRFFMGMDGNALHVQPILVQSMIGNLILAVLFFAGTEWMLRKHLNLA